MLSMLATRDTSHFEISRLNARAQLNMPVMSLTLDTSQLVISPLKDEAAVNIPDMSFALDTSHFEMSALNDALYENILLMSVSPEISHFPIGPVGPLEQSPSADNSMQSLTALSISALDFGENAAMGWDRIRGSCCRCVLYH